MPIPGPDDEDWDPDRWAAAVESARLAEKSLYEDGLPDARVLPLWAGKVVAWALKLGIAVKRLWIPAAIVLVLAAAMAVPVTREALKERKHWACATSGISAPLCVDALRPPVEHRPKAKALGEPPATRVAAPVGTTGVPPAYGGLKPSGQPPRTVPAGAPTYQVVDTIVRLPLVGPTFAMLSTIGGECLWSGAGDVGEIGATEQRLVRLTPGADGFLRLAVANTVGRLEQCLISILDEVAAGRFLTPEARRTPRPSRPVRSAAPTGSRAPRSAVADPSSSPGPTPSDRAGLVEELACVVVDPALKLLGGEGCSS